MKRVHVFIVVFFILIFVSFYYASTENWSFGITKQSLRIADDANNRLLVHQSQAIINNISTTLTTTTRLATNDTTILTTTATTTSTTTASTTPTTTATTTITSTTKAQTTTHKNFPISDKKFFSNDDSFSSLGYHNVCLSDLIPNTKRTHESNSCMQLDLFTEALGLKETEKDQNEIVLDKLKTKVQARISALQNPPNCSQSKVLICHVFKGFGFGSLMHLLGECFLIALGTNRTMLTLLDEDWFADLYQVITPLSASECDKRRAENAVQWKDVMNDENSASVDVVKLTMFYHRDPTFYPFNMPPSIAEPLQCCHGDPNAWWMGQIMKYFVRPQPWVEMEIQNAKDRIGYSHPIVGLHIRRTDKKSEAKYQHLESYMSHAIKWYDCNYARKDVNVTKKIYLATDDPNVVAEAEAKYPDFVFLHDPYLTEHWMKTPDRFSKQGVLGVATDLILLKESDFFVGTFSSNLGRLVYELRQADEDKTFDSVSLDSVYLYHRGYEMWHLAVENHEPQDGEMELKTGDKVFIDKQKSTLVNGYGKNERTNKSGKYPISKVRPYVNAIFYPGFT